MSRSDDPRLLQALVSHRALVLSNTLALAASRYYPRRFGIRVPEWRVIDALHAGKGISANRISQWLRTDKAWVKRSVDRLVAGGYVRRRADPTDARRFLLSLTAKGERAYAAVAAAARRRNENLLSALSSAERRQLEGLLGKLQAQAAALLAERDWGFISRAALRRSPPGTISPARRARSARSPRD